MGASIGTLRRLGAYFGMGAKLDQTGDTLEHDQVLSTFGLHETYSLNCGISISLIQNIAI